MFKPSTQKIYLDLPEIIQIKKAVKNRLKNSN